MELTFVTPRYSWIAALMGLPSLRAPKRGVLLYTYLIEHYVLPMVEAGVLVMEDIAQLIGYARRFANDFVHIEM